MKGKILVSILALGASSLALANGGMAPAPVAAPDYFGGFVAGLDGSVQHLVGNVKDVMGYAGDVWHITDTTVVQQDGFFSTLPLSVKSDIGDTALGLGAFAGYGQTLNSNFYLGGELYGRYANNKTETEATSQTIAVSLDDDFVGTATVDTKINVKSDWAFGGALKLGYLVTPKTMVYLLAGVEYAQFGVDVSHNGTDLYTNYNDLEPFNVTDKYSFDNNTWAFVPGVGIETMLTDKFSLKAEYTYADFGNVDKKHDGLIGYDAYYSSRTDYYAADVVVHSEDKVDLTRGLFTLGLAYHFNGI